SDKPEADAEILMLTNSLMKMAGLKNYTFKVGHVGILRGILSEEKLDDKTQNAALQLMDKKQYEDAISLVEDSGVSKKCLQVLRELVQLKGGEALEIVKDVKECVRDYGEASAAAENLDEILRLTMESGCEISITVDAGFARGLEYYTGMILEVNTPNLDVAIAGGGRYDRLVELFGGEPTPATGIAHRIDRIMLAMQSQNVAIKTGEDKTVMIIPVKKELKGEALKIAHMLRESSVSVEVEVMGRKVTKALEDADRRKINYAVIVGERELKEGAVVLRNLGKREQTTVKIKSIVETIRG
ncbi:MAG: histidine--tRNA ligase family protein, partial [Candidatus Thorarchaeota archaeon]|nr:histidine--tRNA ligase family protein [Candidatus Thorarchaeota archaeon]